MTNIIKGGQVKIVVKIEAGRPVLFFPDDPASRAGLVKTDKGEASRAYMRALPTPNGISERNAAWQALAGYARRAIQT